MRLWGRELYHMEGGHYSFATKDDIVIGLYFICERYRGEGDARLI